MSDITFDSEMSAILEANARDFRMKNPETSAKDPRFDTEFNRWKTKARTAIRRSVYQDTLSELAGAGVPGIGPRPKKEENQAQAGLRQQSMMFPSSIAPSTTVAGMNTDNTGDDDTFGDMYVDPDSDIHEFAALRQMQYEMGKDPIRWGDYKKNKFSKGQAFLNGLVINASQTFEGSAGAVGAYMVERAANPDSYQMTDPISGEVRDTAFSRQLQDNPQNPNDVLDRANEQRKSWQQGAKSVAPYMTLGVSNLFEDRRVKALGADAANPVDIRDRYGRGGGGFFVSLGELSGSALGTIPFSVAALATKNPGLAAASTLPFFAMGYDESWTRRMQIYRDQAQAAKESGSPAPAIPTMAELHMQGSVGGTVEFGSEYFFDMLQKALIAGKSLRGLNRSIPSNLPTRSIKNAVDEMGLSLNRSRGKLATAGKAVLRAQAFGLVEGAEEIIPPLAQEITDPIFIPEGYENDFFSEQTAEAAETGYLSGFFMGTTANAVHPDSIKRRSKNRKLKEAAERGLASTTGILRDKAERLSISRLAANATQTRGSSMALHHLDEVAAGKRNALIVSQDAADATLTEDVINQMKGLGFEDSEGNVKPIGMFNGMRVYAPVASISKVRDAASRGDASVLTGNPALVEPSAPLRGAIIVRNKANQIVEVVPYTSQDMADESFAEMMLQAKRFGGTAEQASTEQLASISESIDLQVDADAANRDITPPSRRAIAKPEISRGVHGLTIDISSDASGSKYARPIGWEKFGRNDQQKFVAEQSDRPFESSYLTPEETGGASNRNVEVTVNLNEVNDAQLSDSERKIGKATGTVPTFLDGKVTFTITDKDGKKRTIEKPIQQQGAYIGQSSPDGLFLIRENGNSFTSRNAFAVLMHELRHKMTATSRGGAEYLGKLLYLDPAFAMRGGAQYMRDIDPAVADMDEADIIGHYAATHAAADAVLSDLDGWNEARNTLTSGNSTDEQKAAAQNFLDSYEDAKIDRATSEKFAEESVAAGQEGALGQTATQAAIWDSIGNESSMRRWGNFTGWMSHRLASNGFMGPEAQQALYEIKQRRNGAIDSELQIHSKRKSELEKKYREDMFRYEDMKRQNKSDVAGPTAPGAAASPSGLRVSTNQVPEVDAEIESVSSAIAAAQSAPPEQKMTLLASALQQAVKLLPYLQATEASVQGGARIPSKTAESGKFAFPGRIEGQATQPATPAQPSAVSAPSRPMNMAEQDIQSQIRSTPMTATEVASVVEPSVKYMASPRNKDFLVGSINHFVAVNTDTDEQYDETMGKLSDAVESGMVSYDDVVADAKASGFSSRGQVDATPTKSRDQIIRSLDINYSLRPEQRAEWERDSAIKNDDGSLKDVFHGTENGDFDTFDSMKIGNTRSRSLTGDAAAAEQGFWFTDQKQMANEFALLPTEGINLDRVATAINEKVYALEKVFDDSQRQRFEKSMGSEIPMSEYETNSDGISDAYTDLAKTTDEKKLSAFAIKQFVKDLRSEFSSDPAALAKIDQVFVPSDIAERANTLDTGARILKANLNLKNPLYFKTDPANFFAQKPVAIRAMQAGGHDGIVYQGEDRNIYFVPDPKAIAITGRARTQEQAAQFSRRPMNQTRMDEQSRGIEQEPPEAMFSKRNSAENSKTKVDGVLLKKLVRQYAKGNISAEELLDEAGIFDFVTPEEVEDLTAEDQSYARAGVGSTTSVPSEVLARGKHPLLDLAQRRIASNTRVNQQIGTVEQEPPKAMFSKRKPATSEEPMASVVPDAMDNLSSLANVNKISSSKKWEKNRDLKMAMQTALNDEAKKAGIDLSQDTPAVREYLVRVGVKDALAALEQNPNSVGWYDKKTRQALAVAALVHPELKDDILAQFAYKYILAVTSNGMKVNKNFELCNEIYIQYKATGKMPENMGKGTAREAMDNSMKLFNTLAPTWGMENFRKFMMTDYTVAEITSIDPDLSPGGENADTIVRGAAIIGPKIGNGFFSNLNGVFDALTMDRWLMRTWGRWTGTLVQEEMTSLNPLFRLKESIASLSEEQKKTVSEMIGTDISFLTPNQVAEQVAAEMGDKANREILDKDPVTLELRLSANSLAKYLDGQKEIPKSGTERNLIRSIFNQILTQVQSDPRYADLTMADLQAALWYAEKRLYENSKEAASETVDINGYADDEAPDYANAAVQVALAAGIPQRRINAALKKEENGLSAVSRSSDAQTPQTGRVEQSPPRGFGKSERSQFGKTIATYRIRQNRIGDQSGAWNYGRTVSDDAGATGLLKPRRLTKLRANYVAEWKPGKSIARTMRNNDMNPETFYELERNAESAAAFVTAISASKSANPFGASVDVYTNDEYQQMRLFLAKDGRSGVGVKDDGDIVSVFSDNTARGGRSAVELAIAAGGNKLDAYDTVLPALYASHGFEAVARIPWNDQYQRPDWDKATFKKFNNGEPDVVFMVLNKDNFEWQGPKAGRKVGSYKGATRIQDTRKNAIATSRMDATKPLVVEASFSMRRGARGVRDEATLRYLDKYDELRRYVDIFEERGLDMPAINNPYIGARLLQGRLAAMQAEAERRYAGILRRMHNAGVTLEEMDRFLTAQHAKERNDYVATINPAFPDGGSGMFTNDANNILQAERIRGRFNAMNAFAVDWRSLLHEALESRRDAGLITRETFDTLNNTYKNYVPLRGAPVQPHDADFEEFGESFGRGLSTGGRGMPASMGRRSDALGVTSQIGFVHEDSIRRVARNEIGQSFLRLVMGVNDPEMAQIVRPRRRVIMGGQVRQIHDMGWTQNPRNFGVYINEDMQINGHDYAPGDLVVIQINNRRLADAITQPNVQLRSFERGLRNVNNAWRFMTTGMGNPAFAPVNLIRDIGTGTLSNYAQRGLRDTVAMMARWPRSFANVFTDTYFGRPAPVPGRAPSMYQRFVDAGGDQVYWRENDLDTKRVDFDALAERVARRDPNDTSLARTLFGWYPAFFAAAETATRLAQFEQRVATGSSEREAALAARELTVDFAKGGQAKPILNTWYMFLNAGLQGTANTMRGIGRSVTLAPALMMLGYAQSALARYMGGDDEETNQARWDNIPDYEKTSNLFFFDPLGSGKYIKIPMPYGYNVFVSAGTRIADAVHGRVTAGQVMSGMLTDSMNAFNPIGGSGIKGGAGNVLASMLPTMARPMAEVMMNEDFSGRPIFPKQFGRFSPPDSTMYFDGTPQGYVSTAEALNEFGGGSEFESSGILDMSPNTMQYLVGYYMSGSGRLVDRLYKSVLSGEDVSLNDIPLARSFVGDSANDTRSLSQAYYKIAEQVDPTERRIATMIDEDNPPELRQRARQGIDPDVARLAGVIKQTDKKLKEIRGDMKGATPEQRKRMLEMRQRVMKYAIRKKNELTDEQSSP